MNRVIVMGESKKWFAVAAPTLFILVATIFLPSLAMAEEVWVTTDKTPLYSNPSSESELLARLSKGERLTLIRRQGRWVKVATAAKVEGYLLKLRITDQPPDKKAAGNGDMGDLFGEGKMERTAKTDEGSSSHSIRGLKAGKSSSKGANDEEAKRSVAAMESQRVDQRALDRFQREGKVGRYAK